MTSSEFFDTEKVAPPEVPETLETPNKLDPKSDPAVKEVAQQGLTGGVFNEPAEKLASGEVEPPKEVEEVPEIKGGSYNEIKNNMAKRGETGEQFEVHHMPADSCTELTKGEGPAIKMEVNDHVETASHDSWNEAKEYRAIQKEMIDNGQFDKAIQMDIDDIHEKFDSKYDEAIEQMLSYYDKLKNERDL